MVLPAALGRPNPPKVGILAAEEVLIPSDADVATDDGTTAGVATVEAEALPEMPNAGAAVLAAALPAGAPKVNTEEAEDPPREDPPLAAVPPPPGLGVSQEAHLVALGAFITKHASHFHSPGFLNMDMSNPPVAVAGAGEAPPAAPPPPALSPPTDAAGCAPNVKPALLVGAAAGVDEGWVPKVNAAAGAVVLTAAVAAGGAPNENTGPVEGPPVLAPARMPPEGAAPDAPLAPGLGVSQEAHLMSPGLFLTRQQSHFHCPGLLNMDMSNPPAAGAGAGDAVLVAPVLAAAPKVNDAVTAGVGRAAAEVAPVDPPPVAPPPG